MSAVTINVTQADIDASPKRGCGDGGNCPVWRAVARAFPNLDVWVTSADILYDPKVLDDGEVIGGVLAPLPDEAGDFIASYDNKRSDEPVEPICFVVEVEDSRLAGAS